jgi:hypothetical protein
MSPQKKAEYARKRKKLHDKWMDRSSSFWSRTFAAARKRALKNGQTFTLTKEWVKQELQKGCCVVTGIPFDYSHFSKSRKSRRHYSPFAPSLDRKNSRYGYTPTNCQVVCLIYNYAKNRYTHDDVIKLAQAIISIRKKAK